MRQIEGIGVQGERRVGDHRGDIVSAACPQRHGNEALRTLFLIGAGRQHLLQGGIFQYAAQAVGTQQPAVGRMRLAYGDVGAGVDVEVTQYAHHDIALRMVARLGFIDATGVEQMLHIAVVRSHADEMTVMQQIGAGVAYMREYPVSRHQGYGGDGGAHARKAAFSLGLADDGIMRGHDGGLHHVGDGLHVTLLIVLLDMRQRSDGDGGGGIAAGMATHAVADGDQVLSGECGILIVGTYGTHI